MIGFILPNASSSLSLDQLVVSVDQAEDQTGIDFFSSLDDFTENKLEKELSLLKWF